MKLSGYFPLLFSGLFVSLVFSPKAVGSTTIFSESSRDFRQNRVNIETNYRYFLTEANYTSDGGQYTSLPTGNRYQLSDLDFGIRWTTGSTWGLYGGSRLSQAESKTNGIIRKNSNISQVNAGVDMLLVSSSRFDFIPDLSLIFPMQRVEKNSDDVLTGEGAMEATARLIARLKLGSFQPFATAGITYRDEGRSTLLPFSAGAELKISSFYLGADISGYQTIIKDKYTSNAVERTVITAKNGGSQKYNSVDPSLLETSAWIRWKGSQFGFHGGAATTVTGANSASGMTFFAGLSFAMDLGGGRKQRSPSLPPPMDPEEVHSDDDVQKFEETINDGVDQNLFRKPAPPPKPVKRPDPAQQKLKMQNELDQTEMQIELKKTSKKKRKN